jgi:hypothetical protein
MIEGLTKNWGKKTKMFPRVPVTRHSGKRLFPECREQGTRGRVFSIFFKRLRLVPPSNAPFLFRVPSSPSVALGEDGLPRVLVFPECHALLGTRGRPSSQSVILPRVQHSGKIAFPECLIFGSRGSSRHSGNYSSAVVCSRSQSRLEPSPSARCFRVATRQQLGVGLHRGPHGIFSPVLG